MTITEDCIELDQFAERYNKKLVGQADFICLFQQAIWQTEKEEKLSKYKMGAYYDPKMDKRIGVK